eukprot:TRINITY_DN270_c0_g2_i1.p1 TRINITY_DN270_c0_g2~~TRINITY_DN270_c0_g2_i1.p1  ORF type:complete len:141 (-),score=29.35 TRINITY_DN270_c0_g2_i1:644-1066(-)
MFFFLRSSIGFVIKSVSIGFGCFKTFSYVEGKQVVGPGWSVFVPKPPGQQPQALPEGPQNQNGAEEQEQEKQRMMEQTRQGLFLFWIVVATAHVLGLIADCASNKCVTMDITIMHSLYTRHSAHQLIKQSSQHQHKKEKT